MGPSAQKSGFRKYKMADGRDLGFQFWPIISASLNIFAPKFGTVMENRQPKGSQCSEVGFSKIQVGGRPPSWISILGHNFGVNQRFCTKFCIKMENGQPNGSQCSEIGFSKIQDGGRPRSWISILGHNFGVDQHFCTKPNFVPRWKIGSIRGSSSQKSDFRKSKMADSRHLVFRFWAVISASLNIIAPNLVQ